MDTQKRHKRVFYELYSSKGYYGRWILTQRHMRFAESDVPELYKKRPFQDQEQDAPEYRYTIDKEGIHIGLFYDCSPIEKSS
ncbi:MAG: hypothetical protein DRP45_08990 [Candidatus Zixiibacteriota bacterium]|nr:MAG: hypothetical protein DRP45_08990 [candidate division Zixibacteria bacterium]